MHNETERYRDTTDGLQPARYTPLRKFQEVARSTWFRPTLF